MLYEVEEEEPLSTQSVVVYTQEGLEALDYSDQISISFENSVPEWNTEFTK